MDLCKTRVEIPFRSVSVRFFVGAGTAKLVPGSTTEMSATSNVLGGFMFLSLTEGKGPDKTIRHLPPTPSLKRRAGAPVLHSQRPHRIDASRTTGGKETGHKRD